MSPARRIRAAADALDVRLAPTAPERLERYVELVLHWNARIRLVGPSDAETLIDDHVADALGFARTVGRAAASAWYDIGAGAGLPSVVLACLFPEIRFTLVEPIAKKTAFLHQAATTLQLSNLAIRTARLEDLPPGGPTAALSRATFAPETWWDRASTLVGPGGLVLVALGQLDAPALRASALQVDDFTLPLTGARRINLLLQVPLPPTASPG